MKTQLTGVINTYAQQIAENFEKRHYVLIDDKAIYSACKVLNNAYGEDLHMWSVQWEEDGPIQLIPLSKDVEKVCPKAIAWKKYNGKLRKYLKLTPSLLKKYPKIHKLYASIITL